MSKTKALLIVAGYLFYMAIMRLFWSLVIGGLMAWSLIRITYWRAWYGLVCFVLMSLYQATRLYYWSRIRWATLVIKFQAKRSRPGAQRGPRYGLRMLSPEEVRQLREQLHQ